MGPAASESRRASCSAHAQGPQQDELGPVYESTAHDRGLSARRADSSLARRGAQRFFLLDVFLRLLTALARRGVAGHASSDALI